MDAGTRFGPYEVIAKLGEGGMGEVYRARDTKLDRDVAIKVLPESFAADADRVARFTREAKTLAALNHPNIAAIYGLEESRVQGPESRVQALVMELVEGEDLSALMASGALRSDQGALRIAAQIADALEAAHEQGIVHRDLKPQNIKVRADGTVKVLDFGLAKAIDPDPSGASAMNSPTMTARATQMGMIIGTAAYMAPEQAKGRAVDKRADIWAFGVVLFEMLTGRRCFDGEDVSTTLAAVLMREPEWTALPKDTPPAIASLVRRCLERDPKARLRDIGEARLLLSNPQTMGASPASMPARAATPRLPWAIAAVLALVTAVAVWGWLHPPAAPAQSVTRAVMPLPPSTRVANGVAVSRDGKRLAYWEESREGASRIMLRDLDQLDSRPVRGTEGGDYPAFSPDGEWIAFVVMRGREDAQLRKVHVAGGTPITLCTAPDQEGTPTISWNVADTIVFGSGKGLRRVSAAGGEPELVTEVDAKSGERGHDLPQMLPSDQAVLFTVRGQSAAGQSVAVWEPGTGRYRVLVPGASWGRYVPTGHLVYKRGDTLFAAPFDIRSRTVTGPDAPVVEGVAQHDYAFSDTGVLVFSLRKPSASPDGMSRYHLAWLDRHGEARQLEGTPRNWWGVRMSPDGRWVAGSVIARSSATSQGGVTSDIWVHDTLRATATKLTNGGSHYFPQWSGDRQWVAYMSNVDGRTSIYRLPAHSGGPPELLVAPPQGFDVTRGRWAPNGSFLYLQSPDADYRKGEIWLMSGPGSRDEQKPRRVPGFETDSITDFSLSPDGKTLAYEVVDGDQTAIYVAPFPGPGPKVRISIGDGSSPRWSRNGKELHFLRNAASGTASHELMSVNMATAPPGRPQIVAPIERAFDVTPDAQRFLTLVTPEGEGRGPDTFIVITNWFTELLAKMAVKK